MASDLASIHFFPARKVSNKPTNILNTLLFDNHTLNIGSQAFIMSNAVNKNLLESKDNFWSVELILFFPAIAGAPSAATLPSLFGGTSSSVGSVLRARIWTEQVVCCFYCHQSQPFLFEFHQRKQNVTCRSVSVDSVEIIKVIMFFFFFFFQQD